MTAATAPMAVSGPLSSREVRERVREAIEQRRALRIVGGASWLDANRPVRAEATLVLQNMHGIVEYEPGDLTLTARAGTTLDEIARVTAAQGQWLALDPPGDPARATLGATIATASYGPLAHHFGTPRDMTLGIEMVTGVGDIVRGGGRVVKNVAGFDLTRLATGSWGALGVLTEVTVRLRARPTLEATLAVEIGAGAQAAEQIRAGLRSLPFVPLAAILLDTGASNALDVGSRDSLLVRLGGNAEAVRAQRDQLRGLGRVREEDGGIWQRLRVVEPPRAAVLRLSRLPSLFARTWLDAHRIVTQWDGAYSHADLGRGVVRLVLPLSGETKESDVAAVLDVPFDGSRIYERLPGPLWQRLVSPANRGRIEQGIKAAFDPQRVLNPGIFGELQ